jgi:hypothetical protein
VLGEQVHPAQLGEQRPYRRHRQPGEAGRRRYRQVGAGMQAEQPEQPRGGRAEGPVRPGEHRAGVGGRVAGGQPVQTRPVAQLAGHRRQRERRMGRGAGRRHRQGQRQPRAPRDDFVGRRLLGRHPVGADPLRQQRAGLPHRQRVQRQRVGGLGRDEAGELVAAGHHHQAGRAAGQQRADLVGVAGVVQQYQHPPAGEQAPVQANLCVHIGRDQVPRHVQRVQETADRLGPGHRPAGRVEAAQVDVELAVGEPVGDPVRPVHRQGGLADAGRTGDRGDDHGRRGAPAAATDQAVQGGQLGGPAGEPVDAGGQLPGHHGAGRRVRPDVPRRAAGQQVGVDLAQRRPGVGAELVAQPHPDRLVRPQRLGLPAGPVQHHQVARPQRLPQRVLPGELAQPADQLAGRAVRDGQVGAAFGGREVALDQPRRLAAGQPLRPHAVERRPPPQLQRLVEQRPLGRRVRLARGRVQQPDEPYGVDLVRRRPEQVAAGFGGDRVGAQHGAQPGQVDVDAAPGVAGPVTVPQRLDQPLQRHRAAGRHRQRREQRPQPAGGQLDRPAVHRHHERSQHPDCQHREQAPATRSFAGPDELSQRDPAVPAL